MISASQTTGTTCSWVHHLPTLPPAAAASTARDHQRQPPLDTRRKSSYEVDLLYSITTVYRPKGSDSAEIGIPFHLTQRRLSRETLARAHQVHTKVPPPPPPHPALHISLPRYDYPLLVLASPSPVNCNRTTREIWFSLPARTLFVPTQPPFGTPPPRHSAARFLSRKHTHSYVDLL